MRVPKNDILDGNALRFRVVGLLKCSLESGMCMPEFRT